MALSLSVRHETGVAMVSIEGELDLASAGELESCLAELTGSPVTGLVVDLTGVTFIDSAGINALLKGRRLAEAGGRAYRVCNASGLVREVLDVTGVWQHLTGSAS